MAANTESRQSAALTSAAIERFANRLQGKLVRPGEPDYDATRAIWNGMIDRRPSLIARCATSADVSSAIVFARDHGLLLSVRGGGHNVAGNAVCDGGLMVDLSPMKSIAVDQSQRTAAAAGGCTWRDLDQATANVGLATTGGIIPATGVGGLTLGGGLGWLMRKHGLSCDNLLSAEVITANGEALTASADEHSDLFWGLRGGGGNFGVVTSFSYRLHPVSTILGGMVIHPLDRAHQVLAFLRDFAATAPDKLVIMAVLLTAPDGNKVLAVIVCYCGDLTEGERVLQPLRKFASPVADQVAAMPYLQQQGLLEAGFPPGRQNYWKSSFLNGFGDDAIATAIDAFQHVPSPTSAIAFEQLGGAMSRLGEDDTAFTHRSAPFNFLVVSSWEAKGDSASNIAWTRSVWQAMQPHAAGGVYVNYLGPAEDEGPERIKAAYGAAKYDRLLALKRKYDPANLFRLNQNIRP